MAARAQKYLVESPLAKRFRAVLWPCCRSQAKIGFVVVVVIVGADDLPRFLPGNIDWTDRLWMRIRFHCQDAFRHKWDDDCPLLLSYDRVYHYGQSATAPARQPGTRK
jgi:hypothetical protein